MPDSKYINDLYCKTYPCDGFNAVDEVYEKDDIAYLAHPITKATSFLGIPNRPIIGRKQSWLNIGANLLGLFPSHSPLRYLNYTGVIPLVFLVWNLATILPKLTLNIAKVFTEFLPALLAECFRELSAKHYKKLNSPDRHFLLKPFDYVVVGIASIAEWICDGIFLLGRCLTSPVKSMRMALKFGEEKAGRGAAGKVLGVALLCLSLAVTATIYTLLFPFVAQLLAPYVASIAPVWAVTAYTYIQPYLTVIGTAIEAVIGATLMPAVTGLGAVMGFVAATIGSALGRLIEKSFNWIYHGHGSVQEKLAAKLKKDLDEGYEEHSMSVIVRTPMTAPKKSVSKTPTFFAASGSTDSIDPSRVSHDAGSDVIASNRRSNPVL